MIRKVAKGDGFPTSMVLCIKELKPLIPLSSLTVRVSQCELSVCTVFEGEKIEYAEYIVTDNTASINLKVKTNDLSFIPSIGQCWKIHHPQVEECNGFINLTVVNCSQDIELATENVVADNDLLTNVSEIQFEYFPLPINRSTSGQEQYSNNHLSNT